MKTRILRLCLILSAILQIFILCGCSGDPFIVFSTQNPKNGLNKNQIETNFKKGDTVYYVLIAPKGFKDDAVRISLSKKDTKSELWGYSNYRNKTIRTKGENYYSDYFIIREEGIFVLQAFFLQNLSKPIATGVFRVYDN